MNWQIKKNITASDQQTRLEQIKSALLSNRGLDDSNSEDFFNPPRPTKESLLALLTDLDQKSLNKAVTTIKQAIKAKTPIIVYGDYDADGVCATAILWETLYQQGANALPFIPSRSDHGYGLNLLGLNDALKLFKDKPLVITVDNGVSAIEAADYLKDQRIELIITDHHQPPTPLPHATAIIHTTFICGSLISWLLSSFLSDTPISLELAALGTVCDLIPLDRINRPIVKYGLLDLATTTRPGLLALFNKSAINLNEPLSTYHLGFLIGPRLNASGRLNSALTSLRLLCTKSTSLALKLAEELNTINLKRQQLTADHSVAAINSFTEEIPDILLVSSENYHEGIIGLIASRLANHFHRPAIAISLDGDVAKGSARSIPGIDITSTLKKFNSLFTSLGGHHQAAGFSLSKDNLSKLKQKLSVALAKIDRSLFDRSLSIDAKLEPQDLSNDLFNLIQSLAPFGIGNPEPVFTATLTPKYISVLGKTGGHLKFSFDELPTIEGLLFATPKKTTDFPKSAFDVAYQLKENHFAGRTKLQLIIKDIQV